MFGPRSYAWSELFRTGLIAWGVNLSNPNPPFSTLVIAAWKALENATSDPSNPAGHLRHLASIGTLNDAATSSLTEGLDCYVAGLFGVNPTFVSPGETRLINWSSSAFLC